MTYEELFVQLDEQAKTLPRAALRLLLHLIARCIRDGGNEVRISTEQLAKAQGSSRDTVRDAIRSLTPLLLVSGRNGVEYTFTLPDHWFSESRGLFAPLQPVENPLHLPGNQAGTRLETRQVPGEKPGRYPPGNQAGEGLPGEKPGRYPPGNQAGEDPTRLETRQVPTQNEQLSETASSRSRSSSVCYPTVVVDKIYQIANVEGVPVDLVEASSMLCEHLRAYARDQGNPALSTSEPDERILARCLAIAPLGDLVSLLRKMRSANTACGYSYAWFVTIFAQRIHRVRSQDLEAAFARAKAERSKQQTLDMDFSGTLISETRKKVRRWA